MSTLPARSILVAGPPCSGKTTYVELHKGEDDLVLDFDSIARDLGSPAQWLHPQPYRSHAEQIMRARISSLPGTGPGTAWVVRSAAAPHVRAIAARQMRAASCVLVNPGLSTCLARAEADHRPPGTADQIRRWYATFKPWSGDRVLTAFELPEEAAPAPAALGFFGVLDGPPALDSTIPLLDPPPTP